MFNPENSKFCSAKCLKMAEKSLNEQKIEMPIFYAKDQITTRNYVKVLIFAPKYY